MPRGTFILAAAGPSCQAPLLPGRWWAGRQESRLRSPPWSGPRLPRRLPIAAIESVNSVIRKFTRNRKIYPNEENEESALTIIFMALREAAKKWTTPIRNWKAALNHFAILFEDRRSMQLP
jgi:hypothetical protein